MVEKKKFLCHIYLTKNLINDKGYVGKHESVGIHEGWYKGSGSVLRKAIEKYGWNNFKSEVVLTLYDEEIEELNKLKIKKWEDYYINYYNTKLPELGGNGYNVADGGQGGNTLKYASEEIRNNHKNNTKKTLNSKEVKNKLSESTKKRFENPKEREKISKTVRRVLNSEEIREKISNNTKKALSLKEVREKISISHKKRFENPKEREKISKTLNSLPLVICPFCKKEGHPIGMTRWHFEKCKYKQFTIK